jgi:general secretion pathway protein G
MRSVVWFAITCIMFAALACISSKRAKEAELVKTLSVLRSVSSQFTLDHRRYPHSLDELVVAGYWKQMPFDPITHRNDTWQVEMGEDGSGDPKAPTGIVAIHSGSNEIGSNGVPYRAW